MPSSERHEHRLGEQRLGVQWVQDGQVAGELFTQLGELAQKQGQHGQAIGLLRRAIALGAPRASVLPTLAECFVERGRAVAALACIDEAVALGIAPERLQDAKKKALSRVGPAYQAFRDLVGAKA